MAAPYIPMAPAAPVLERPVAVVGPQFCMPHPIDLSVTSKTFSMTDADFAVTDVNGNLVFKVKGKFFSLHDKCALLDSTGNPVVSMQQKIWSAHRRWHVYRGGSSEAKDLLFSLKKSSFFQMRTELDVFLAANTNEGAPDFKIKGSFSQRSCAIYLGETNTVLARMTTHETVKSIVLGNDIFGVTVYPNVDYAFIIALIVVLDQINQDRASLLLSSLS